jgi:hypothetical protein
VKLAISELMRAVLVLDAVTNPLNRFWVNVTVLIRRVRAEMLPSRRARSAVLSIYSGPISAVTCRIGI